MIKLDFSKALGLAGELIATEMRAKGPEYTGAIKSSVSWKIEGNKVIVSAQGEGVLETEYGKPAWILGEDEVDSVNVWEEFHGAERDRVVTYLQRQGIEVGTVESPIHITSYGRDTWRPWARPSLFNNKNKIIELIKSNVVVVSK